VQLGTLVVILWCLLGCILAWGQRSASRPENQVVPAETSASDIPGVIAAGTKLQLIKQGLQGAQGATSAPDDSNPYESGLACFCGTGKENPVRAGQGLALQNVRAGRRI
jgi:hypothetical protein